MANDNSLKTAVLIIGKSGVGKSSLLNYMFDEPLEKTGAGKPVTGMGLYQHEYQLKDNFIINLYDSWGLEADKSKEWFKLINDEVIAHDRKGISEWFNTIIFCINKNAHVEDFECDIIKSLLVGKNNVVVALTHCDSQDPEENRDKIDYLEKETGITLDRIINISSVRKELISGKSTTQFGKDELIVAIEANLWASICGKLPNSLKGEVHQNTEQERRKYLNEVKKKIHIGTALVDKVKFFNKLSGSETMEKFSEDVSKGIEEFSQKANNIISNKLIEANEYYLDLYNCYNNQISVERRREIPINIKCDFLKDYQHELKGIITFKDLKNIKGAFKHLLNANVKDIPYEVKEIAGRVRFVLKSVKEKRRIAIETINQCFDDLETEFGRAIDAKLDSINSLYLELQ